MEALSSTFLQALGWATLNSIWQIALLWGFSLIVQHLLPLSSNRRYQLSVLFVFGGFIWYLVTFFSFFFSPSSFNSWQTLQVSDAGRLLPGILNAASIAYLMLLIIPVYRIYSNWQYIQKLKTAGLDKASASYRLFVKKLSMQLGMNREVKVYISQLISSPVTIGFLKPIILLPVAAVNNLSTQQMEAVLLHELAHIRRHDYLVNLLLTSIHVILYFNPFVKAFLRQIEAEREASCDDLVLQYQYDSVSYASALLQLEKSANPVQLAMAAADKYHLLQRIEKIVGLSKKRKFNTTHLAGALVGLLMILAINTLVISNKTKVLSADFALDTFNEPSSLFIYGADEYSAPDKKSTTVINTIAASKSKEFIGDAATATSEVVELVEPTIDLNFMHASYNDAAVVEAEAKVQQVASTVEATKKVLVSQWKEVERAMADGMTAEEKEIAKQDYLEEVANIDWLKIQKDLETTYNQLDWTKINGTVSEALQQVKLDSIETNCRIVLNELHKLETAKADASMPLPDVSIQEITKAKTELKARLDSFRKAKNKKVINL